MVFRIYFISPVCFELSGMRLWKRDRPYFHDLQIFLVSVRVLVFFYLSC
jgi:hypothetical protein